MSICEAGTRDEARGSSIFPVTAKSRRFSTNQKQSKLNRVVSKYGNIFRIIFKPILKKKTFRQEGKCIRASLIKDLLCNSAVWIVIPNTGCARVGFKPAWSGVRWIHEGCTTGTYGKILDLRLYSLLASCLYLKINPPFILRVLNTRTDALWLCSSFKATRKKYFPRICTDSLIDCSICKRVRKTPPIETQTVQDYTTMGK